MLIKSVKKFLNTGSKGQYANQNIYKNYSQNQIR